MLEKNLLSLGFTQNQIKVYIALLQLGQTKVGPLLHKTGLHRNIVYRALNDLIKLRLANVINRRGINYYAAIDPGPILLEQKKKRNIAKNVLRQIKDIQKISYSETLVLAGQQGILDLCEMVLKENTNTYVIGAVFNVMNSLDNELERFKERAKKKDIKHYALAQAHTRNEADFKMVEEIRFLPKSFPPTPHVIWTFGQVSSHILWEEPQTIFVIRNQKIAESYRQYFKLLWKKAKKD